MLDDLTAPTYRAKYSQYLAGLHFVASSSFRTADFKTAMAAIEKSIKLTQYMEANDPDEDE